MVKNNAKENIEEIIKDTLKEIFKRIKISGKVKVVKDKEQDHYRVNIETSETGLLIGRHGETINSLQLILGIVLYKKLKKWIRVVLDVGGYRENRKLAIKEMVERIVKEVERDKQSITLPYLTPYERRIVHLMIADNNSIVSESQGKGKDRRIVIKPRDK